MLVWAQQHGATAIGGQRSMSDYVQVRCTPVYLKKNPTQAKLAGGGVQSWRVLSPMGPPFCPDMPDTEHSSQTDDPTWRTASSMPITDWWEPLQPQETERLSLGSGMWGKKWRERYKDYNQSSEWGWSKSQLMPWSCIRVAGCECVRIARIIPHSTWHPCFHGNL